MKRLILITILFLIYENQLFAQATRYVTQTGAGAMDGTSWSNAFASLQSALSAAVSGDQIWVAAGIYKPSVEVGGSGERYKTFQMKNGVAIYGGFAGTETSLSQRNISANVTILSGDIGALNDSIDNCYHVFYHPDGLNLNNTAILDGFTIKDGNANESWPHSSGSGILNYNSSPSISNCIFTSNSAVHGGGIGNYDSSPTINNSIIWGNIASGPGNQLYIDEETTTLNYSCYANGFNDVVILNNGTFTATNNNITTDPMFVGTGAHPYLILGISPCVDAGNNSYISEEYDIRGAGYPRKLNKLTGEAGTVDMGAYEYKYGTDPLAVSVALEDNNTPKEFLLSQNYPNPFNPVTVISYQLSVISNVGLKVFDMLGCEVATLVNEVKEPGRYEVKFNASHLSSGVYFYKLQARPTNGGQARPTDDGQAGNFTAVKKLLLMK